MHVGEGETVGVKVRLTEGLGEAVWVSVGLTEGLGEAVCVGDTCAGGAKGRDTAAPAAGPAAKMNPNKSVARGIPARIRRLIAPLTSPSGSRSLREVNVVCSD